MLYKKEMVENIEILREENKELKDRIGNAISYVDDCIKEWIHDDYDVTMYNSLDQEECDKLLKILKGEWSKE